MKRLIVIALSVAAGCASAPVEQNYTLSVEAGAKALRALTDISIAVGAARLPEVYDRPQLVMRASENRVQLLEQQRWAEPLKSGIARVVAADLGRALGTVHTTSYPAAEAKDTGYRVSLDVQRFDATPGKGADVDISWRVRRLPDGPAREGRTHASETAAGGYETLIAAQSRALATVSRDIAQAIVGMQGS